MFKRLFGRNRAIETTNKEPLRTFSRIPTGDYFGLRNENASKEEIEASKKEKIEQIKSLGLLPKCMAYKYSQLDNLDEDVENEIVAAQVIFQKEEFIKKENKIHTTEISFIVPKEEFEEFEAMAGVSLKEDFENLYKTQ